MICHEKKRQRSALKKILIIKDRQFGYHNGTYFLNVYLKEHYDLTNICYDLKKPKISLHGVDVIYLPFTGNKLIRKIRFILKLLKEVDRDYDVIFVRWFMGCSFLKIFSFQKKMILDIITGHLSTNNIRVSLVNSLITLESLFFKNITVLSEGLGEFLRIKKEKVHVLPLGSDIISDNQKKFHDLRLLYVGVLTKERKLGDTIRGLKKFYDEYKDKLNIQYTIIGDGNDEENLKKIINDCQLAHVVQMIGFVHHSKLTAYFDNHNVGVSYVPRLKCFEFQPPTKTFESLAAGMPVIATDTAENRKIVNHKNGVLIADNKEGFYDGLKRIIAHNGYDSDIIRQSMKAYTWRNIMQNNLRLYFQKIIYNSVYP
jgi:glycosyltransferase involved in cell wall biosynthesis